MRWAVMWFRHFWARHRWKSIAAVICVHLALGYILITGLQIDVVRSVGQTLQLVDVRLAPPPPEPESPQMPDPEEEGGAAPPGLRAEASPVAAPEPAIVIPRRQEVTAAPEPNEGSDGSQGAAEEPGPGTGGGGEGTGTGRGAGGNGAGGAGVATPARRIAGDISRRDYPPAARRARVEGTVGANVHVGADGRVTRCDVVQSSGNAELDTATCRLIEQRFRYEPARNAAGDPVPDVRGRIQRWWLGRD